MKEGEHLATPYPERPTSVWQSWKRANRQVFLARWWRHWRIGDGALFAQSGCLIAMAGCEVALWPMRWRAATMPPIPPLVLAIEPRWLAAALVVLGVGNVVWTLRIVLRRRALGTPLRPAALLLLALSSAPPLLGLLAIPLWRSLEESRPRWLTAGRSGHGPEGTLSAPWGQSDGLVEPGSRGAVKAAAALARWLYAAWAPLAWFSVPNLLLPMLVAIRLPASPSLRPVVAACLVAVTATLHLTALATAVLSRNEPEVLTPPIRQRRWLELLWLLPFPIPVAWFLVSRLGSPDAPRSHSLAHAAFLGGDFLCAQPAGLRLAEQLRTAWSARAPWRRMLRKPQPADRPADLPTTERRFLAVARWKVGGLLLDGFALATGTAALGILDTAPQARLAAWMLPLLGGMVALIALTVLLKVASLLALRLGGSEGFLAGLAGLHRFCRPSGPPGVSLNLLPRSTAPEPTGSPTPPPSALAPQPG